MCAIQILHRPSARGVLYARGDYSEGGYYMLVYTVTVSELTPDISHIPPNANINEYPLIRIGRQLYLKADWLKLKRKRTSWVSDYGTYLVEVSDKYEKKKIWWSCNLCDTAKKI